MTHSPSPLLLPFFPPLHLITSSVTFAATNSLNRKKKTWDKIFLKSANINILLQYWTVVFKVLNLCSNADKTIYCIIFQATGIEVNLMCKCQDCTAGTLLILKRLTWIILLLVHQNKARDAKVEGHWWLACKRIYNLVKAAKSIESNDVGQKSTLVIT